jgi:hypothetical protein
MTLEQSVKASFNADQEKFPLRTLSDYDIYMLAFCRGVEHMSAQANKELDEVASRIGLPTLNESI